MHIKNNLSKKYIDGIIGLKDKHIKDGSVEYNKLKQLYTSVLRSWYEKRSDTYTKPTNIQ